MNDLAKLIVFEQDDIRPPLACQEASAGEFIGINTDFIEVLAGRLFSGEIV